MMQAIEILKELGVPRLKGDPLQEEVRLAFIENIRMATNTSAMLSSEQKVILCGAINATLVNPRAGIAFEAVVIATWINTCR